MGLVGLVQSYHHAFLGISWVRTFFLLGIPWVPNFYSWVFCGTEMFSYGYFVGANVFLVGVSWLQNCFSQSF